MKLFLIDGHALIFKMHYAFNGRPMLTSKGEDTSIIFGFTKYLLELILREKPSHIAVSFDPPGGTFRNEMYPAYKANRPPTPQQVIDALEPLTGIVGALNIPILMRKGFEADDVIGTMALRSAARGFDVYMVTPDKDYGQLVGGRIFQYKPGKSGSDNEILGEEQVCAKWNIARSSQVIDVLAICGDSADNVPGVQGVGPVGAAKLLAKYGSVEGIYEHIGELSARQQQLFEAARDHIGLSRELVTIKTDINLDDVSDEDMVLNTAYSSRILELIDRYEMPSLKRNLREIAAMTGSEAIEEPSGPGASLPDFDRVSPEKLLEAARAGGKAAILLQDGTMYAAAGTFSSSGAPESFASLLEDEKISKVGAKLKATILALADKGLELKGLKLDTELMHYLINPERSHDSANLVRSYLGVDIEEPVEGGGSEEPSLFDERERESSRDEQFRLVTALLLLEERLSKEIAATQGLDRLYSEIEEPLVDVLAKMERTGVKIDLGSLREFAEGLRKAMLEKESEVRELAGEPQLNISSPKQVGEVIFEKLKLDPKAKRPKSGNYPTDEQTLSELADRSPIIGAILDYRGLRKLLSTYIEPLGGYISPRDGRVHTTFNQTLTATGRLSSSNPNLQNIPIRTEQGREIRKAFVAPGSDSVMMAADYSQIELRLMAHLCGDSHMREAFIDGLDVHKATAAKIFRCPLSEVSADQRRVAKTANFGIMYGISAFGLSQRLQCSRSEAKQIIDDYFASFPSIREFIDASVASARANGYVETIFGRRRYLPDINSQNANLRSLSERNAVNAPIQGSAADIIKLAMIGVDRALSEQAPDARMVLQIHDELLLEVPRERIEQVRGLLVREMEGVVSLSVPLTVECNYGENWLDAH